MDSYDVRFFDIKKLGNGTAARYRVRWAVDGRDHCKSFKARHLADRFLDGLKDAVRFRRPFDPRTGLPGAETTGDELISWYAHARSYGEAKWANLAPGLPPVGRRGSGHRHHRPHGQGVRRTGCEGAAAGAVRLGIQPGHPPARPAAALGWAERVSLPVSELEDTATVRLALAACGTTLTGRRRPGRRSGASGRCSTTPSATPSSRATCPPTGRPHPVDPPAVVQSVDRRVVVSPAQA